MSEKPATDLELAERLARQAGDGLMTRFAAAPTGVDAKSSQTDLVSDADRTAEAAIVEGLRAERPDDGLLGEEGASSGSRSGRRWVIDPLDGTTNYLYRHHAWCVSIAVEDGEGLLAGVVHCPRAGETFTAARGGGAFLNGEPIRVREDDRLETALLATGFSYDRQVRARQAARLTGILPGVRDIRRNGSAALDLAWVAAGRFDGYWESDVSHWDVAAGMLLVAEAGGIARPLTDAGGIFAATPAIAPALEPLLV